MNRHRLGLEETRFPVPLPAGIDAGQCLWLGSPEALMHSPLPLHGGLRIDHRQLEGAALLRHFEAIESRLARLCPENLWCLIFLDDVTIGSRRDNGVGIPPGALAAALRWLQRQPWSVYAFLVSHERVPVSQRNDFAELARHLGRSMYRHQGVRREAFSPISD